MIDKQLLEILVCPQNHTPLSLADEELIERLNRAVTAEDVKVVNLGGAPVEEPLAGGLVRQDGKILYPIVDDIPVLLVGEAISLEQIDG